MWPYMTLSYFVWFLFCSFSLTLNKYQQVIEDRTPSSTHYWWWWRWRWWWWWWWTWHRHRHRHRCWHWSPSPCSIHCWKSHEKVPKMGKEDAHHSCNHCIVKCHCRSANGDFRKQLLFPQHPKQKRCRLSRKIGRRKSKTWEMLRTLNGGYTSIISSIFWS